MNSEDTSASVPATDKQVEEGRYQPKPIRRVHIPKMGSAETRPLGIPTVRDRVVQSAIKLVIEPIFEKEFAPSSFGFRPGRGCKDALREAERLLREGRVHVVDVDIKGYFDNIPHDKLMALVRQRIADGKVLGLIESFLKVGVLEEGIIIDPLTGSPQGGIISPLLANINLNPLDWLLHKRCNKHSMKVIIELINPKLRGWFGYFKQAHPSELQKMDAWVRRRLRSILRTRKKGRGRGHGLDHFRWPNRYFENLGLFSLNQAREDMMSLLRGAKR